MAAESSSRPRKKRSQRTAIADAELVVMKALWRQSPSTANEVVAALGNQTSWSPKTVQTFLSRLVAKGAIGFDKEGREYHFRPLIAEAEYQHAASRSFLQRVFDGELAPFLACFLEREKVSAEEIKELRRLLDDKKVR